MKFWDRKNGKGCRNFLPSQKRSFWGMACHTRSLPSLLSPFSFRILHLIAATFFLVIRTLVLGDERWLMLSLNHLLFFMMKLNVILSLCFLYIGFLIMWITKKGCLLLKGYFFRMRQIINSKIVLIDNTICNQYIAIKFLIVVPIVENVVGNKAIKTVNTIEIHHACCWNESIIFIYLIADPNLLIFSKCFWAQWTLYQIAHHLMKYFYRVRF